MSTDPRTGSGRNIPDRVVKGKRNIATRPVTTKQYIYRKTPIEIFYFACKKNSSGNWNLNEEKTTTRRSGKKE